MTSFKIILYYKYVHIYNPEEFKLEQLELCKRLELTGRIILATEGINGTLEGTEENIQIYIDEMHKDERFADLSFKTSPGTGTAFPKLSVKVRPEIVSLHLGNADIDPNKTTGKYISAEELHSWINSGKQFYIIDMRNDYEHKVGYFANSLLPELKNFRDLPKLVSKFANLKDSTVVTVCTGGVRCEKASGFLVEQGFKDVYQLHGGIVTYMEKYPNQGFKGKLYVFDGRVTMGFNTDAPDHEIVGRCEICGSKSDNYVNCANVHCKGKRHFICCADCTVENLAFCSEQCKVLVLQTQK